MTVNLKLYVERSNYDSCSSKGWPTYDEYIQGKKSDVASIQQGIDAWERIWIKDGIKFPIEAATACQNKWTWSSIYLNLLSTASCHRVKPVEISLENFDDFHNTPKKLEDRSRMLQGLWPNGDGGQWPNGGCEYCKDIEDSGGFSDRMHVNTIRKLTPIEVETDFTATRVTPKIVELFAQNTCNLSCIYCNAGLSSKIEQENIKHGDFKLNGVHIPVVNVPVATQEYFDKFLNWLDNNVQSLLRLHLLGGETFLQHDLMNSVLEIIGRKPNPKLELNVFSNCNVPDRYWNEYTGRIQQLQESGHIRIFDLTASIDCWGPQSSYVRSGLNLDKFESRMAWAVTQPWIRLNINQTITAMTIKTMPDLVEKINKYSEHNQIGHYFQFYTGPQMFQHPKNFGWSEWENDFDRLFNTMREDNWDQQQARQRMAGLKQQLQQVKEPNIEEIRKLQTYLNELDRRRGTDWRELFPFIAEYE